MVGTESTDEGVQILTGAAYYVIETIKYILYSIALVYIVLAGLKIVTANGDESAIKSNKDSIVFGLFGFIIILLADVAVRKVFYGGSGDVAPGECLDHPELCAEQGKAEILQLVFWGKSLLAIIAVIEIIVSGIRMIMAIGEEDIIKKEKKVFVWVGIGLVILAINETLINDVLYKNELKDTLVGGNNGLEVVKTVYFSPDLQTGVNEFVGVIQFILQFIGVFAIASLIYGGFLMLMNLGDDEMVTKAKTIIKDAILGLIFAYSAYAIIATILIQ